MLLELSPSATNRAARCIVSSGLKQPLVAVWRIAEKGNVLQFESKDEDCVIKNKLCL